MTTQHIPDEDGYDGPAQLIVGDAVTDVQVRLAGQFDPISGHYRWRGRVAADPSVRQLLADGVHEVQLRTPHATVTGMLGDADPWGRPRIEGVGEAPFVVLTTVPSDDAGLD